MWHGGIGQIEEARKSVICALEATGWKVVRRSEGEAYYTSPSGRQGTLCLRLYQEHPRVWRWHVDHFSVRMHGQSKRVDPQRVEGSPREFSFQESESLPIAEWLTRWLLARESHCSLPEVPHGVTVNPSA